MPKMHFFDIECLDNIFTLTNYYPEQNLVRQYYLADDELSKKLDLEENLKAKLTERVNLRNRNFTPDRKTLSKGNGHVELYNLKDYNANVMLAREFGMSTSKNVNDPTDATNLYPNGFRITADTDKDNGTGYWSKDNIYDRYNNKLSDQNLDDEFLRRNKVDPIAQLHYHEYNEDRDPYILGYNSANYDLTILAIYLQDAFTEVKNPEYAQVYSHNATGYHYFKINPDKPHILRKINNLMFSHKYRDNMPSILFNAPRNMNFRKAFQIRKNMLMSGRHLDVSRLNEKMSKVGLKRLLGMRGFQILESDKLKPGTDKLDTADQFYELLAYNASDCINLAALFFDPRDQYYVGQFNLKKSLLAEHPMVIYKKQDNSYAPNIAPDSIKRNRMTIDSSSAQIATNVVCPYGHLNDINSVSFNYPEARKAAEVKINQFNVLNQTKEFFMNRLYLPAKKVNKKAADEAKTQFDRVMNFYSYIQNKNFNDSVNYYAYQLAKTNPSLKNDLESLKPAQYESMFSTLNTFDLLAIDNFKTIKAHYGVGFTKTINISREFIKTNKIVKQNPLIQTSAFELVDFIAARINDNSLQSAMLDLANQILNDYDKYSQVDYDIDNVFTEDTHQADPDDNLNYAMWRRKIEKFAKAYFKLNISLESYSNSLYHSWGSAGVFIDHKKLRALTIRPYDTSRDLPVDNYCLPFFNSDATPSRGYALFSVGGIHGAEYNYDLYQEDIKNALNDNANENQMSLFDNKQIQNTANIKMPQLFKPNKDGTYKLNERYVYTSIDPTHHEDFSSYYPSLCRMLNVYWNDGIGKDVYGEVYDQKEALGVKMKDKEHYSEEQRDYFKIMRQGTKLILNSTTGKGDSHGQNSPIQMNNNIISMRLIGQMFTWRIGQAQTIAGAKVISTNTDGLYTVMADTKLNDQILADESKEIHVRIDPERLYLISKDANNRIESDIDTLQIKTPSGGNLGAYYGPTPTKSLAHPAAIDRALGMYLQKLSDPNSGHTDLKLMKHFDYDLGRNILHNLLGDINNIEDDDLRVTKKREYLNFFQNVVSSSPGTNRYIFTSDKFYKDLNNINLESNKHASNALLDFTQAINQMIEDQDSLSMDHFTVTQHYNRVFYIKQNSSLPNKRHIYVAAGRKVNPAVQVSRKKAHQIVFDNSELASKLLNANGVSVRDLNNDGSEAKIVKLPSLPPEWTVVIMNQSLDSLNESECDTLIDALDYDNYLELLATAYTHNWSNNVNDQKAYDKALKAKYKH